MDEGEGEVLVEEVTQELAHAQVGPAPVHQQEALQEAELGEGVVAGQHRLHALLPADAHADMGSWRGQMEMKTKRRKLILYNIETNTIHYKNRQNLQSHPRLLTTILWDLNQNQKNQNGWF